MGNRLVLFVLLGQDACSEPPSCQQAVTHYYDAGCVLVNLQTGQPYPAAEVITNCKNLLAIAPDQCIDDLENLRSCWGSVKTPARTNADCDCSAEQDAILTCE